MPKRQTLPICIEAPEHVRMAVAYAAEELFRDLGVRPQFVQREELDVQGIYYGQEPEGVGEGVLRIWSAPEVETFLRRPSRISGEESWWVDAGLDWEGEIVHVKDPLATAFVWLSGWHEEATTARDVHGRVRFSDSIAKDGPTKTPVDDIRNGLARVLEHQGVSVSPRTWGDGSAWAVALTHDVDALPRSLFGTALRLFNKGISVNRARKRSVDALLEMERRLGVHATWFVKTTRRSRNDARLHLESRQGRQLIHALKDAGHEIGLHPTYFAADHPDHLAEEKEQFKRAVGAAPSIVRMHYLRWLPATQSVLSEQGFRLDSTLGFAESEGFRRGTCHPFRFYDCRNRDVASMWEAPLAFMDTSFVTYQSLSLDDMMERVRGVFGAARKANGVAVILWHPAVDVDPGWDDRLRVLQACLTDAQEAGAFVGSLAEVGINFKEGDPSASSRDDNE